MRLMTKAEACRELAVSLSTLDRRIASGEIRTKQEPRGRRHRIYVMLDGDPLENGLDAKSQGTLLDVAQERIRGLDEQVSFLEAQLQAERDRYDGLLEEMKARKLPCPLQERQRTWWRFWRR